MPFKLLQSAGSSQAELASQFRGKEKSGKLRSDAKPSEQDIGKSDEHWEDMKTFAIFLALAPFGLSLWLGIIWFIFWLF